MATLKKNSRDPFQQFLDKFRTEVARFDGNVPVGLFQAMRSLLAAMEYADGPLIRSHLETALSSLAEAVDDAIVRQVEWSRLARSKYQSLAAEIGGSPGPEFDEIGHAAASDLDHGIRLLSGLRDGVVRDVSRVSKQMLEEKTLNDEIAELELFKLSFIGGWPWSHLPRPEAYQQNLIKARGESERSEGVPIEDLIRQIEQGE